MFFARTLYIWGRKRRFKGEARHSGGGMSFRVVWQSKWLWLLSRYRPPKFFSYYAANVCLGTRFNSCTKDERADSYLNRQTAKLPENLSPAFGLATPALLAAKKRKTFKNKKSVASSRSNTSEFVRLAILMKNLLLIFECKVTASCKNTQIFWIFFLFQKLSFW